MEENELRSILRYNLGKEALTYFGTAKDDWLNYVTEAWLDDKNNSRWRFKDLERYFGGTLPNTARILDMACGCGTFIYFGLLNGLDVWGIDPEDWKLEFNHAKCAVFGYPSSWKSRFIKGVGEALPFPDAHFDLVASYQTLEHVQSVELCLSEMARVLKPGGTLFLHAPDYRSTFEAHYQLPWLPLFPRPMAHAYLRLLGRPAEGLATLNYVTAPSIKRVLSRDGSVERIVDQGRSRFNHVLGKRWYVSLPYAKDLLFVFWKLKNVLAGLFHREISIDLIVVKKG